MPNVPEDTVPLRLEDARKANRELHRAERARKMPTGLGDSCHDLAPQLLRELRQRSRVKRLHVRRRTHVVKHALHGPISSERSSTASSRRSQMFAMWHALIERWPISQSVAMGRFS